MIDIQKDKPFIVFVHSGQSIQHKNMASKLYEENQEFKDSMDRIDNDFKELYSNGESMLTRLRKFSEDRLPNIDQYLTHVMCFMLQVSLYEVFKKHGIEPDLITGISCGELACAYKSGMINRETAYRLVYERSMITSRVLKERPIGAQSLVEISKEDYDKHFGKNKKIEISGQFSPKTFLLSSPDPKDMKPFTEECTKLEINFRSFAGATAFHSSILDFIKNQTLALKFESFGPEIPIISTVTSKFFNSASHPYNPQYMFRNLREPVNFNKTVVKIFKHLEKNGIKKVIFLEISPSPTFSSYIPRILDSINSEVFNNTSNNIWIYSALDKNKEDVQHITSVINSIKTLIQ